MSDRVAVLSQRVLCARERKGEATTLASLHRGAERQAVCERHPVRLEIAQGHLLEGREDGLVLTVDGAARGMEGNLARLFCRQYPDAWEDIEDRIVYPIPLGSAQLFELDPDIASRFRFVFIASTLHHLDALSEEQKLAIQGNALRAILALAERKGLRSIATALMVGGWRLEAPRALDQMVATYLRALSQSARTPLLRLRILELPQYQTLVEHVLPSCDRAEPRDSCVWIR